MLNLIVVQGRLAHDPELRSTTNGVSVTRFSLAVQRNYASKGSERVTDFLDVVAWRQSAEFVCKYFRKGNLILVNGELQTGSYEKDGIKRKTYEIVASSVYFSESNVESRQQVSEVSSLGDNCSSVDTLGKDSDFSKQDFEDDDMLPF